MVGPNADEPLVNVSMSKEVFTIVGTIVHKAWQSGTPGVSSLEDCFERADGERVSSRSTTPIVRISLPDVTVLTDLIESHLEDNPDKKDMLDPLVRDLKPYIQE